MSSDHGHGHGIHPAPTSFWTKYVFSIDHKVIAIQFLFGALLFLVLGGALALGVRYQLAWPAQNVPYHAVLPGLTDKEGATDAPSMVDKGAERNLALWKKGGDVELAVAVTAVVGEGENRQKIELPKGTKGRFVEYPKGIAVTLNTGVMYQSDGGSILTVTGEEDQVEAWVEPKYVMADYKHETDLKVITVPGKPVTPRGVDAARRGEDASFELVGMTRQVVNPTTGQPAAENNHDRVLLPQVSAATPVVLRIDEQQVTFQDAEGNSKTVDVPAIAAVSMMVDPASEADVPLTAEKVQYQKIMLKPEAYLSLFTMHATLMVFFVLMPMLLGTFANFTIPLMIGARDMAFPKLNMLSFWINVPASLIILLSFWVTGGSAGGGWTMYPTLSGPEFATGLGTTVWCLAIFVVGFSTIVGTLNYITTIVNMRAPGMTMFRMPLTIWSLFITAILGLFATPVLAGAGAMLLFDRTIGTHFFNPDTGGQPILWQHLFWFFGHPEVYILILPAMGIASDCLSTYARKPIFGYRPMAYAMAAIAGLGFIVWGHHMFQSGMNPVLGTTFMATTIMIAVPSAIKTFNWLGTLWGGNIKFTPAMLFACGFVSMFVIGGLSGIFMAAAPVDIHIHDTYFIVAHIHYVLFGGTIFGVFAGIYHWFPKMFGTQLNQRWGVWHFILSMIGFNGTFFIMHVLGLGGHPRRYYEILKYPQLEHLQDMNVFMTIFAIMMGAAQLPFIYNVFASLPRKLARSVTAVMIIMLGLFFVLGRFYWSADNFEARQFLELPGMAEIAANVGNFVAFDDANLTQMDGHGIASILGFNAWWALIWGTVFTLVFGALWRMGGGVDIGVIRRYVIRVVWPSMLVGMFVMFMFGTLYAGHNLWLPSSTNTKPYVAQADIDEGHYDTALASLNASRTNAIEKLEKANAEAEEAGNEVVPITEQAILTEALALSITDLRGDAPEPAPAAAPAGDPAAAAAAVELPRAAQVAQVITAMELRAADWHDYRALFAKLLLLAVAFSLAVVAVTWGIWWLGGLLHLKQVCNFLLYVLVLPIFMSPLVLKKDPYIWIGYPEWFPETTFGVLVIMGLFALPGIVYFVLVRPKDRFGYTVSNNPVDGNTLEWCTTNPPPHYNFEEIPVVYRGPYEYASPVVEKDYLPQTEELPAGVVEPTGH